MGRSPQATAGRASPLPHVVLIHGLDSWSGTWQGTAEELARRGLACIALDLRGHGLSPLGAAADFGPARLAADVRAALLKAGVLRAKGKSPGLVLVGHSMGGRIAMRYAADFPEDVAAVVIEDMDCTCRKYPAEYLEPGGEEMERKRRFDRAFASWEECRAALISFGYDSRRVDGYRTEDAPRAFLRGPEGAVWSAVNPYAQWLARRTVLTQNDSYAALQRLATLRACDRADLAVHVLVAGGEGTVCSWDALPGGIRDMEAVLPGLVVTEFPKAAHSIHRTEFKAFVDFVEKVVRTCQ